jgi:hypothetical protein
MKKYDCANCKKDECDACETSQPKSGSNRGRTKKSSEKKKPGLSKNTKKSK